MKKFQHWLLASIALIGLVVTGNLYTQAQQTAQGEVQLEIQAGNSCCVYGTSVAFGEKDINFGITEFSGDFLSYYGTNTWGCRDLLGTETGRAMYIAMSGDMENQNGNKIASGNVKISFDETQLVGGDCVLYNNSGIDVPLNDSVALVEKDGNVFANYGKICELGTTNVKLKVVTNTGQAPGNYVGTLVIDLPSFVNSTCDGLLEGTFYDAETDGLSYIGNMGSAGITANSGTFTYKPGEEITFKIGNVTLGNPVTPATNGSVFVTDLFGLARTEITDPNVIEVATLLQGLDDDNDPENGILISSAIAATFTESGNVTGLDVSAKLIALSKPVRTAKEVVQHLEDTANNKLEEDVNIQYSLIKTLGWSSIADSYIYPDGVVMDKDGNSYIVSSFHSITLSGITLVSSGGSDIFIGKIDKNGNWVYINQIKSQDESSTAGGSSIAIDGSGNNYVLGYSYGTVMFGTSTLIDGGLFLAKLDNEGNWLRTNTIGDEFNPTLEPHRLAVDNQGNAYVMGSDSMDLFVRKINSDGNIVRNKSFRADPYYYDYNYGISSDGSGNVYIASNFSTNITLGETTLSKVGEYYNALFAKLDTDGNRLWAKQTEGSWEAGNGVTVDDYGNNYVLMSANSEATFGSFVLTGGGAFLGKIDSTGNILWTKKMTSIYGSIVYNSGYLYIKGSTEIGKFDLSGNIIETYKIDGILHQTQSVLNRGSPIYVSESGEIVVIGIFNSPIDIVKKSTQEIIQTLIPIFDDLMIYKIVPRDNTIELKQQI